MWFIYSINEGKVRVGDLWCGCRGTKGNGDDDDTVMMVRGNIVQLASNNIVTLSQLDSIISS